MRLAHIRPSTRWPERLRSIQIQSFCSDPYLFHLFFSGATTSQVSQSMQTSHGHLSIQINIRRNLSQHPRLPLQ
jgi:hypothetical protein